MNHLPRIKGMTLNLDTNGVSLTLDTGEHVHIPADLEDVLLLPREPRLLAVHLGTPWERVFYIPSERQADVLSAWLELTPALTA